MLRCYNQKPWEQPGPRWPRITTGNPATGFVMLTAEPRAGEALATTGGDEARNRDKCMRSRRQTLTKKTAFKVFQIKHKYEYIAASLNRKKKGKAGELLPNPFPRYQFKGLSVGAPARLSGFSVCLWLRS